VVDRDMKSLLFAVLGSKLRKLI